jgi:hypothetical protein
MATISTSQTLDSAARSAGEAMTIQSGATLTIDTHTRFHKNAPASATGALSSFTMTAATGGRCLIDGRNVWMVPYDGGTSTLPALGGIITGATSGATGELFACMATITTAPVASGASTPATGFLMLKSITGTFQDNENLQKSGPTTIGQVNSATGGYRGFLEVVFDDAASFTIGRAQKLEIKGDWYTSPTTTNGSQAQQIQFPNFGGALFFLPGVWVETSSGSNSYEFWPAMLSIAASGWAALAGGMARAQGTMDDRQKFVRCVGGGLVQFGERLTQAATYTWASNAVVVTFNAHGRQVGQQIYLDFTSGGATADGLYTITAVAANTMTVTLTGSGTAGNVTVGYDVGKVPASGCKVRIPNILLKSCATGTRAADTVPNGTLATRPDVTTTNAGQIDIDKAIGHWQINSGQAYSVSLKYLALFDQYTISECATSVVLEECHTGNYTMGDVPALVLTSNFAGGSVTNCKHGRCGAIAASDYGANITNCNNFTFTGGEYGCRTQRTNAAGYPLRFSQCKNPTISGVALVGGGCSFEACINPIATNTIYADNYTDVSLAITPPLGALLFQTYCVGGKVEGFSFFGGLANMHPDTAIVYTNAQQGLRIQNIGTYASPLNLGTVNACLYFLNDAANSLDLVLKRIYVSNVATRFMASTNSTKGLTVETCYGDYADTFADTASLNAVIKGMGCASWIPATSASIYGSAFYHINTSNSAGRLGLLLNEATAEFAAYITTSFTSSATGVSGFNSSGGLALINSGDYAIFEFPWRIIGIDSFQNSAPTVTTATNMTTEYQIDTGSGWNGTWKTFNAANLSGETVDEVAGFKFKIRITANATAAANIVTVLYCLTSSNTTAQGLQYPLDTNTLTLTGLVAGTEIHAYLGTDPATATELAGTESSGTSFDFTHSSGGSAGYITLIKTGLKFLSIPLTYQAADASIPVFQSTDLAYANP